MTFTQFFFILTTPRIRVQQTGYPKFPKSIGEHIRKRRMDLGLLQKDVANTIGVSECTIYNWENDGSQPATQYIPSIINFLGYVPFKRPGDILGRLAYFKRIKGMNLDELGAFMNKDPEQLSDWLRYHKKPRRRNLESINQFLAKHRLNVA